MKFKNRSLWPSCLGGATLGEAAGSSTTLKILTANGQVLRFSEPWSMTAADLLAHTAHPHHMVCEGNPEDFFFHHSRLTKLSSTFDDDSSFDTESVSDRSDTNSFSASPARRSFGSLTAAAAAGSWSGRRRKTNRGNGGGEGGLVGLSPLTPVPSFGSLMVKRFFLRGGDRKDLLGGFLASPIQRLRSVGRTNRASSPWQLRSPGESQHRGRISPLQMSRNAFSDVESEVGSEDGSCDLQVPRFERGRILPLDAELESGRVYYLVPMPRLLPDFGIDSDLTLPWGPSCPAPKCSCLKAFSAKQLQQESKKKSSRHSRPAFCASMRCNKSHGLMIMGSTNSSSKINPRDSERESDFLEDVTKHGASTISHGRESWSEEGMVKRPGSPFPLNRTSLPPHLGRFPNELAAYRSEEQLLRDERAAKVARAQYRIPPAYCLRAPWKVELPIITEDMIAVHNEKATRTKFRSKDCSKGSPRGGHSPEIRWPPGFPHHPGLRNNRSPRRQGLSPGRRGRKSPDYLSHSPHSPSFTDHSPARYGTPSPHVRLLEKQLSDSPLHLPATSPEPFQAIPPKLQLSSPDRSPAPLRYVPPPQFQLSSPERSSFRHNNLNPPTSRQTHLAYNTTLSPTDTFRLSEAPAPHGPPPDVHQDYSEAASYHHFRGTGVDTASSGAFRSVPSQQGIQPCQSPSPRVDDCFSGKTWQMCSPQRSEATHSPGSSGRPGKSVGSPGRTSQYQMRAGPESAETTREPFTPTWPNPAPRLQESGSSAIELLHAAQLGMVQQGSNGRFRSSPAWRDIRQITPGRLGRQVGRNRPGHNGIMYRSSSPAYSGYGGPTR